MQHCKAIFLQFKKIKLKKKEEIQQNCPLKCHGNPDQPWIQHLFPPHLHQHWRTSNCLISASLMSEWGLPWWLSGKEPTSNAGHMSLIPGSGRSSGEGNGNTFQYSCLENPMDQEAWWATVHQGTNCPWLKRLNNNASAN